MIAVWVKEPSEKVRVFELGINRTHRDKEVKVSQRIFKSF